MSRKRVYGQKDLTLKSESVLITTPYPNFTWNGDRVLTTNDVPSSIPAPGVIGSILRPDGTDWIVSTTTYPNLLNINTLLYASSANVVSGLAYGVTSQVLTATTGAAPSWQNVPTELPAASSSGSILRANGTNWIASTSTYPDTNAINTLLYASAANTMSAIPSVIDGVLTTSHTGVPALLPNGTTGQVLTATTGATPSWQSPGGGVGYTGFNNTGCEIVYVSVNGTDAGTVGDGIGSGTLTNPFLTVPYAMTNITDNASNKRYVIQMGAGLFSSGSTCSIKPFVTIKGIGDFTRWNDLFVVDATYNAATEPTGSIEDLSITSSPTIDFSSITDYSIFNFKNINVDIGGTPFNIIGATSNFQLTMDNVFFPLSTTSDIHVTGNGGYLIVKNCDISYFTINGGATDQFDVNISNTRVDILTVTSGIADLSLYITSMSYWNNLSNWTLDATAGSLGVWYDNLPIPANLTQINAPTLTRLIA